MNWLFSSCSKQTPHGNVKIWPVCIFVGVKIAFANLCHAERVPMAAKIEYDAGIWPLLEEVSQSLVDQNHIRIPQFELTLQDLVSDATMRLL